MSLGSLPPALPSAVCWCRIPATSLGAGLPMHPLALVWAMSPCVHNFLLTTLHAPQRLLACKVAEHYGLQAEVINEQATVLARKTPNSRWPTVRPPALVTTAPLPSHQLLEWRCASTCRKLRDTFCWTPSDTTAQAQRRKTYRRGRRKHYSRHGDHEVRDSPNGRHFYHIHGQGLSAFLETLRLVRVPSL